MRSSVYLGTFLGIRLQMHFSFLFIFVYVAYVGWQEGFGLGRIFFETGLILGIFLCVVLHEYGHALMARRFGIDTAQILLLPIGGVAQLKSMPEKPSTELLVAIAGPLVNLAILFILVPLILVFYSSDALYDMRFIEMNVMGRLALANVILFLFNLIPAFPMDGGRVLRALLSFKIDFTKATLIAVRIGQLLAIGFAILGFYFSLLWIFIALFIFLGAETEYRMVRFRNLTGKSALRQFVVRKPFLLDMHNSLEDAIKAFMGGRGRDFLVVEGKNIKGILREETLRKAMAENEGATLIKNAELAEPQWLNVTQSPLEALQVMAEGALTILPVRDKKGKWIGAVYLENLFAALNRDAHETGEAA